MRVGLCLLVPALCLGLLVITACTDREVTHNKPSTFWYEGILKNIRMGDLESADSHFSSLQGEHVNSPLLPEAMLMLGQAHMDAEEYVLSDFYFKEYLKRYGSVNNSDYILFLRIKSHYHGFRNSSKDQQFITDSISLIGEFLDKYPGSRYSPLVHQMEARFILGQNELNTSIVRVYNKQGKALAEQLYMDRIDVALQEQSNAKRSKIPWYVWVLNW